MTPQAVPLRAETTVDRPLSEVRSHLASADGWRRAAAAVGLRSAPQPENDRFADGQVIRLDRIGRRRRPVARHRVRVELGEDGVPAFTVVRGAGTGGRLTVTAAESGGRVLVTAEFAEAPAGGRGIRRQLRAGRRRRMLRFLQLVCGMSVLAAHQTRVVVAAAVLRDGAVLAARRSYPPGLAGRWEFPGGKVAPGETDVAALHRELAEELGPDLARGAEPGEQIGPDIALDVEVVLRLYAVRGGGEPVASGSHDETRWIPAAGLADLDWLDADRRLLPALRSLLQ